MSNDIGIWAPYQAFYIESMLSITSSAIDSTEKLVSIFDPSEDLSDLQQDEILDWIQNIFTQAAALSRYFWTVKKKDKLHNTPRLMKFTLNALFVSSMSVVRPMV